MGRLNVDDMVVSRGFCHGGKTFSNKPMIVILKTQMILIMRLLKRSVLLILLVLANMSFTNAQSLTGEARSHWNKASIYTENASSESEWQLVINELEQVAKLASGFDDVFLKLGDAYSHLSNAEAVEKAKYYWKEYEKRVPSSTTEIQDKIDRLEAGYQIASLRNRERIIESLIGRWRYSKESTYDFWSLGNDMELFREGNKLMLRYVSFSWWYNGGEGEPGGVTAFKEISLNSDGVVIEYERTGEWRDKKDGKIVDSTTFKYKYRFVISQPHFDGVIKGTEKVSTSGWNPPDRDVILYKVE